MHGVIRRGALVIAASFAALLALPVPVGAVLSGINGRIVFVSGRGAAANDDSTADVFLRPAIGSIGAGSAEPVPAATGANQHRHPTWSPDRTMIAYAHGDSNCNPATTTNCAIYLLDLTDPNATPQAITAADNVADDRPAWSPDGTRIAFESENANASGQLNIKIYDVGTGNTTDFTSTTAGTFEHKPAWTPDSQTLYYVVGDLNVANAMQIVSEPSGGGTVSPITVAGAPSEFQPSISPDGTRMCYTRGTQQGSADSRVVVALANGGGSQVLPVANTGTSYNCTWSPDGTKIAYALGAFTAGDLVIEDSDASGNNFFVLEGTANHFDGNPDWAPDGRPSCQDATVTTDANTPVQVPVACPDSGPQYEQTSVRAVIDTPASRGTTSPGFNDPAFLLPTNVTYTPNTDFVGTDTFTVLAFDEVSFANNPGTLTVHVRAPRTISFDATKAKKKKTAGKEPLLAVTKGKKAQFSGDVSAPQSVNVCEANQPIELQRKKPTAATFTTFLQLQSDAAGNFSVKRKIKKTFQYRAVLGQTQACEDATSSSETVKAKKRKK